MRVLLVEDEVRLADNLAAALRDGPGFAVDWAADGVTGDDCARNLCYDLIVLDLMLPRMDGQTLLKRIRGRKDATPVLILTAKEGSDSIIELLNAGADDYMAKPFDLGELLARAKALVRRGKGQRSATLAIADLRLDTIGRSVRRGNHEIALTPMEYRVLEYLFHRPRAVVSKTELLEHLYDYNWEKFSNVIEVYISGLRRKIDDHHPVKLIHTVRGHGYVLRAGN